MLLLLFVHAQAASVGRSDGPAAQLMKPAGTPQGVCVCCVCVCSLLLFTPTMMLLQVRVHLRWQPSELLHLCGAAVVSCTC